METLSLAERDRQCLWHPFTQMYTAPSPIPIIRGKGSYLIGEDHTQYLDAFSSWWVNLHGHAHPHLIDCLTKQAQILDHVIFTDFTHQAAVELGERLLKILPSSFTKVFYTDNGSTAVEAALKMVFQYWFNKSVNTKKRGIVCFKGAYHGDTFGAMSLAAQGPFNEPFWPYLFQVIPIDPPYKGFEENSLAQLKAAVTHQEIAGFIFEPHVQGVGGMKIHSVEGLDQMIAFCHQNEILTIADEVMTGFGRTGPLFVIEQLRHLPDIICLAKGLTGGMMPLAVTLCSQDIYNGFISEERKKAFLHGHSYYANPLACAVALGSLDLLVTETCENQRLFIEHSHRIFCEQWKNHPSVKRMDYVGTILIVEYQSIGVSSYFDTISISLKKYFLEQGILVRPFGNILHIMPPYCIEEMDLQRIYQAILFTLENPL